METPFLQVTLEDNTRFGITATEPIETGDLPPIRVQPATAESLAAAEPEAGDAREVLPRPVAGDCPHSRPGVRSGASEASERSSVSKKNQASASAHRF